MCFCATKLCVMRKISAIIMEKWNYSAGKYPKPCRFSILEPHHELGTVSIRKGFKLDTVLYIMADNYDRREPISVALEHRALPILIAYSHWLVP